MDDPVVIPAWWENDVVLSDGGTVHVRPRREDDRPAIIDFYSAMSEDSRYLRFSAATTGVRAGEMESRAEVDLAHHFSVLAELGDRIVAIAAYHRNGDDSAEIAFSVADDQQGRGLGTVLLEYLAVAAREQGIRRFTAWVLSGNFPMLQVFRSAGFAVDLSSDGSTVEINLDLTPTDTVIDAQHERERVAESESIRRILRPASIAVVGAGRKPGSIGHAVFRNLIEGEFTGTVYPVNPHAAAVAGVRAYPDVASIPDPVDLVVVTTPAGAVLDVVDDCAAKGVGGLVVITAGFAETGGADLEHELVARARRNGMRVIGPNCMGILNTDPAIRMNATFTPYRPEAGRIAFASQSGGLGIAILGQGAERGLGISSFVSMGNKADVSSNDLVQFWEEDPDTDVILLYLESFGNPRKFARLARRIARRKPIIAVKSGRSAAGVRGTTSHTASLAAPDATVDALFDQAGVTRVDTLEELFDTATLMAHQPLPRGRRIAVVSNGGGPAILAADALVARGLDVPELSAATQEALATRTAPGAGLRNPVDLVAAADADTFAHAIRVLQAADEVDAVVVIFVPPLVTRIEDVAQAILDATADPTPTKPIVACFLDPTHRVDLLHDDGRRIPVFSFPEAAAVALGHAARLAEWRRRPEGEVPELDDLDPEAVRAVVDRELAQRPEGGWLDATVARDLLDAVGVRIVTTERVPDVDAAIATADRLGYPVAMKVGSAEVVHKSDVGGVHLGLESAADVHAAWTDMADRLGGAMGGALVQPMVAGGVETIIGVTRDPLFGSLVLFGMGGFAAELTRDTALSIVPLTDVDAEELVHSLRSSPLFFGYRNSPPVDVMALQDLLVRIGSLAELVPEISELDCNPVIVNPDGAVVVDTKVRLAPTDPGPPDGLRRLSPTT